MAGVSANGDRRPDGTARSTGPRVSLILALHHGEEWVLEGLRACLEQTCVDIEVVIVDPGRSAATTRIVESCSDTRMRVVRANRSDSLPALWNRGLALARGDWFVCITETARLVPDAIERLLATAQADPAADLIHADVRVRNLAIGKDELVRGPHFAHPVYLDRTPPCYMVSRRAFERIGGYDARVSPAESLDLWFRVLTESRARRCDATLCEQVVVPWRTRDTDWIHHGRMATVVRERQGIATAAELRPWLQLGIERAWSAGPAHFVRYNLGTMGALFRVSVRLGVRSATMTASIIAQKTAQRMRIASRRPVAAAAVQPVPPGLERCAGTQVLCLVPRVVMGGSEKVVRDIVDGLTPLGFRFHLGAAHGDDDQWCESFRRAFDNVMELPDESDTPGDSQQHEWERRVVALIESLDVDVVLMSNSMRAYRALPTLRARFPGLPIVDILHVQDYAGTSDECLDRAPYPDHRVCISEHLRQHMLAKYRAAGIHADLDSRMSVIHNGIDMHRFDPSAVRRGAFRESNGIEPDVPIVAWIGRLSFEKRPVLFLDVALRVIRQGRHDVHFVIAGDGAEYDLVQRFIRRCGHADRFTLTRVLGYERVPELLADAAALVMTSSIEGLPLVIVEAMAMNVPVVTTDVGAISSIVLNERSGLLIEPDSDVIEDTAKAIVRVLDGFEPAAPPRESVVERFSMEAMHRAWAEVLSGVTARR